MKDIEHVHFKTQFIILFFYRQILRKEDISIWTKVQFSL